jgi:hypothetical protein
LQRRKNVILKPGVYLRQHGFRHLLLAAREEMIKAAFAQPCGLADKREACAIVAVTSGTFGTFLLAKSLKYLEAGMSQGAA